jgi:MYXO-CTERM domain-containing protein
MHLFTNFQECPLMKPPFAWLSPFVAVAAIALVTGPALAVEVARGTASSGLAASPVSVPIPDGVAFVEGFNGDALPAGWSTTNLSANNVGGLPWLTGTAIVNQEGDVIVSPFEGSGFALVSFRAVASGAGTINTWLFTPVISNIANGDRFSFFTTTTPNSAYPDRLELRLNASNTGTNVGATTSSVGDFTITLASVNPTLEVGGYPEGWTQITGTVSGLAAPVNGRVALRYFVTDGGPGGANSNIIGVDSFVYAPVPEPATWAMALVGLAGLAGWRRMQRG